MTKRAEMPEKITKFSIDISNFKSLECDPLRRGNRPVLARTRFTAAQVLSQIAAGDSVKDLEQELEIDGKLVKLFLNELAMEIEQQRKPSFNDCSQCGYPLDNDDPDQGDDQWYCPRCKGDLEIERLREKNLNLYKGFQDCLSCYDADNLTMQSNERKWKEILHANKREPRGI